MIDKEKKQSQTEERLKKLKALEELGINPYGHRFLRSHSIRELKEKYGPLDNGAIGEVEVPEVSHDVGYNF